MKAPLTLTELDPQRLRVGSGWIESAEVRGILRFEPAPGDTLAGYSFEALLEAARGGRRLLLDESDGSMTLEAR